jgi:hypothetical protein
MRFYQHKVKKGKVHVYEGDRPVCGYAPTRLVSGEWDIRSICDEVEVSNADDICQYCAGALKTRIPALERNVRMVRRRLDRIKRYKNL